MYLFYVAQRWWTVGFDQFTISTVHVGQQKQSLEPVKTPDMTETFKRYDLKNDFYHYINQEMTLVTLFKKKPSQR